MRVGVWGGAVFGCWAGLGVLGRVGSEFWGLGWLVALGVFAGVRRAPGLGSDEQREVADVGQRCGEGRGPGPVEGQAEFVAA